MQLISTWMDLLRSLSRKESRMTIHCRACCAFAAALLFACPCSAGSIGHWHLPSTTMQWCGLGFGPGHHAPMMRTHGGTPLQIPRYVHRRGCLSGGMAYGGAYPFDAASLNCHAQLDAITKPNGNLVQPGPSPPSVQLPPDQNFHLPSLP